MGCWCSSLAGGDSIAGPKPEDPKEGPNDQGSPFTSTDGLIVDAAIGVEPSLKGPNGVATPAEGSGVLRSVRDIFDRSSYVESRYSIAKTNSSQLQGGLASGRSGLAQQSSSSGPGPLATVASWHPVEGEDNVSAAGTFDGGELKRGFTGISDDMSVQSPREIVIPLPAAEGLMQAAGTPAPTPEHVRRAFQRHAPCPHSQLSSVSAAPGSARHQAAPDGSGGSFDSPHQPAQRRATFIRGLTRDSFLMNNTQGGGAGSGCYMMRTTAREEQVHADSSWPPFQMGNPLQVHVGEMLGRGGCGSVYLGTWRGHRVAIKVVQQVVTAHGASAAACAAGVGGLDAPQRVPPLIDYFGSSSDARQPGGADGGGSGGSNGGSGGRAPHLPDAHASVKRLRHPNVLRTYAYAAMSTVSPPGTVMPSRHEHHVVLELCDGGSLRAWLDTVWRVHSGPGGNGGGGAARGPAEVAAAAKAAVQAAFSRAQAHIQSGVLAGAVASAPGPSAFAAAADDPAAVAAAAGRKIGPPRLSLDLPRPSSPSPAAAVTQALAAAFGSTAPAALTTGTTNDADAASAADGAGAGALLHTVRSDQSQLSAEHEGLSRRLANLNPALSQQLQLLGMAWLADNDAGGGGAAEGAAPPAAAPAAAASPAGGLVAGSSVNGVLALQGGGGGLLLDGGGMMMVTAGDAGESCVPPVSMSEPSIGVADRFITSTRTSAAGRNRPAGPPQGCQGQLLPAPEGCCVGGSGSGVEAGSRGTAGSCPEQPAGVDSDGASRLRQGADSGGCGEAAPCTAAAAAAPPPSSPLPAAAGDAGAAPSAHTAPLVGARSSPPPLTGDAAAVWVASSLQRQRTDGFSNLDGSSHGSRAFTRHPSSSHLGCTMPHHHYVILEELVEATDDSLDSLCRTGGGNNGKWRSMYHSRHHAGGGGGVASGCYASGTATGTGTGAGGSFGTDHSGIGGLGGLFGDLRWDEPLRRLEEGSVEGPSTSQSRSRSRCEGALDSSTANTASVRTAGFSTAAAATAAAAFAARDTSSDQPASLLRGWSSGVRSGGGAASEMPTAGTVVGPPSASTCASPAALTVPAGYFQAANAVVTSPMPMPAQPQRALAPCWPPAVAPNGPSAFAAAAAAALPAGGEPDGGAGTVLLNRRALGLVRSVLRKAGIAAGGGAGGDAAAGAASAAPAAAVPTAEPMQPVQRRHLVAALECLGEVAAGLAYLHGLGMVHGDVKSSNVLLQKDSSSSRGFITKLADFGFSRVLEHGSHTYLSRPSGTLAYLSPELLTTYRQSAAADQYAFGLMVWEAVTAQPLFLGMQTPQVLYAKTHNADWHYLHWPAWVPHEVRGLARRCAEFQPSDRLTAAQAVEQLAELHARYQALLRSNSGAGGLASGSAGRP